VKLLASAREEADRSKEELKTLQMDSSRLQQALKEVVSVARKALGGKRSI